MRCPNCGSRPFEVERSASSRTCSTST